MTSESTFQNLGVSDSLKIKGKGPFDPQAKFKRHLGVHDTKEFLSDIKGRRTKWPLLIAISLVCVGLLGYSASQVLFEKAHSPSEKQIETGSIKAVDPSKAGDDAVKLESMLQPPDASERTRGLLPFSLQAEAEAAVEGEYAHKPEKQRKSGETEKSLIEKQVFEVLKAASDAVRNENLDSFMSLLDESKESFVRQQKLKAKVAFRQFDQIDGEYSDVKIEVVNDDELAVNLHCKVNAEYARSGRPVVLFNGDQNIVLRKAAGQVWKICSID